MNMKWVFGIFSFFMISNVLYGDMTAYEGSKVDCLVLEDENSIICKYSHKRVNKDKTIRFEWVEPDGTVSRVRDMVIPSGHGSIYDYRYIKGRTNGTWTFKAIDETTEYKTTFDIK
jgi:hypothetical protein